MSMISIQRRGLESKVMYFLLGLFLLKRIIFSKISREKIASREGLYNREQMLNIPNDFR